MNISRGWLLAGVVAAMVATACGDNKAAPKVDAAVDADEETPRQRGEYIVNVLSACGFCHTPLLPNGTRDPNKVLAGIDCFIDLDSPTFMDNMNGMGCLSTRNLTNHATGLGNRTDTEIKNAFRNGIRTDGKKIVPVMPWWLFHNMTDDDADAVVAYLRSLPPVDHTVKPNEPPFAQFNDGIDVPSVPFLAIWAAITPILDAEIPLPRGGANNESAMRGRYLTGKVGLCIDCHTPEIFPFALQLDLSKTFAGGKVFPKEQLGLVDPSNTYPAMIATRNLTSDMTGLGGWTKMQIKLAIAEGRDRDNKQVCAATHGGVISPYAALTEQDLDDIAEYISQLPAIENDTANDPLVANCGLFALPPAVGAPEMGTDCTNGADDDGDGTPNDGCPETGTDCDNITDDDGDTVPNDGCPVACNDCQGPAVP